MADKRFFHNAGPIRLSDLVSLTGAEIALVSERLPSDGQRLVSDVAPLDRAGPEDISFLDNVKYAGQFAATKAGACFVRRQYISHAPADTVLLVTDEPYYAYALAAQHFYPARDMKGSIDKRAVVSASAIIGDGVRIDAGAVIGEHVRIGSKSWIGANTVISDGVEIGEQCNIGAVCSLSHAILGNRVIIHRGVHIGQDGFGFAGSAKGIAKVPQLGRVIIGDNVEIGSGTCIDRGAGPDTMIGNNSKIDNLVQIGHNVHIGSYVMIAAGCGIAGSTHIGDGAMLGGQVGLSGHIRIGAKAKLAAQAGVMTDVPPGATYGGSPAVPVKDWHRQTVALGNLIKRKELANE